MKKKMVIFMMCSALGLGVLTGCGTKNSSKEEKTETEEKVEQVDNQAAADIAANLIDAIYVQKRTDDTDVQCAEAKKAWDALTKEQKELVSGEFADPDYFGKDTGDAKRDDPLNQDDIGDKELLVVSFGTSYNDSRVQDIGGIEQALIKANPDWSVRRAFTSQIIINHIQARDDEKIDNVDQALERAIKNGVKNLIIQPTHLMYGSEYDELIDTLAAYKDKFESVAVAEPLLGKVGTDAASVNDDKKNAALAVTKEALSDSGYDSIDAAEKDGTAYVFLGHGTSHTASVTYTQMQTQMELLGYKNVFIGTVEGKPEDTACEAVIEKVKKAGYKKIVLRPLMVVAGDHAYNDMAGEDADSWKNEFISDGCFETVTTQIEGLGSIKEIQEMYVEHTKNAVLLTGADTADAVSDTLEDGTYLADFTTDSGMFHVNEACKGKGKLTVKDGKMTIHISLTSKKIASLFLGTAQDAQKEGADILKPSVDTVTFDDGTTEEVNGFDVPVYVLGSEFDLALLGSKGTWYDHKVSVSNPEKTE